MGLDRRTAVGIDGHHRRLALREPGALRSPGPWRRTRCRRDRALRRPGFRSRRVSPSRYSLNVIPQKKKFVSRFSRTATMPSMRGAQLHLVEQALRLIDGDLRLVPLLGRDRHRRLARLRPRRDVLLELREPAPRFVERQLALAGVESSSGARCPARRARPSARRTAPSAGPHRLVLSAPRSRPAASRSRAGPRAGPTRCSST